MPNSKTGGRLGSLAMIAALLLPPGIVGTYFAPIVKQHLGYAVLALIGYGIVFAFGTTLVQVHREIQKRAVARLTEWADASLRRIFSRYTARYLRYVAQYYRDMDVKGLTTQGSYSLSLDEVFVDLTLLPRPLHQMSGAVIDPEDSVSDHGMDGQRSSIWELLTEGQEEPDPLAVIGGPGSGKTTLLKHIAIVLAQRNRAYRIGGKSAKGVPVLLFLREHGSAIAKNPDVSIAMLVAATPVGIQAKPPPGWLLRQLERGRCIVMFDGLDEVAIEDHRKAVVDWVERQVASFPNSQFVVTSRPFGYRSYPVGGATVAQVRPFTEKQIETFIDSWYLATEARKNDGVSASVRTRATKDAADLMARLRRNARLFALAENPLLLTMIAHVHNFRGQLPGTRADLYREICQVFLGRRQEAKGLQSDLTPDQKEHALRRLAYEMMRRQVKDLARTEAAKIISPELRRLRNASDPETFLIGIEQGCGLIIERERHLISFAHLTFQEYLAAAHIADKQLEASLAANVADVWWHEVVLLYVAQRDGDEIVKACLRTPDKSGTALALAAECVEDALHLAPELRREVATVLSLKNCFLDPVQVPVVAAARLSVKLRRVDRVGEDAWVCNELLTNEEFGFYLADNYALREDADPIALAHIRPDVPADSVTSDEALSLIRWMLRLGIAARLPTSNEVKVAARDGLVANLPRWPVWAFEGDRIVIMQDHLMSRKATTKAFESIRAALSEDALLVVNKAPFESRAIEGSRLLHMLWRCTPDPLRTYLAIAIGIDLSGLKDLTVRVCTRDLVVAAFVNSEGRKGEIAYRPRSSTPLTFDRRATGGQAILTLMAENGVRAVKFADVSTVTYAIYAHWQLGGPYQELVSLVLASFAFGFGQVGPILDLVGEGKLQLSQAMSSVAKLDSTRHVHRACARVAAMALAVSHANEGGWGSESARFWAQLTCDLFALEEPLRRDGKLDHQFKTAVLLVRG